MGLTAFGAFRLLTVGFVAGFFTALLATGATFGSATVAEEVVTATFLATVFVAASLRAAGFADDFAAGFVCVFAFAAAVFDGMECLLKINNNIVLSFTESASNSDVSPAHAWRMSYSPCAVRSQSLRSAWPRALHLQ
jgi:hypothetical protein